MCTGGPICGGSIIPGTISCAEIYCRNFDGLIIWEVSTVRRVVEESAGGRVEGCKSGYFGESYSIGGDIVSVFGIC